MNVRNESKIPIDQIERNASRYRLKVRHSAIHHRGVFALQAIPRNRKVIEYAGAHVRFLEAVRRQRRLKRLGKPLNVYYGLLRRGWVIDGSAGGNGSQFINHCCDPNLGVRRMSGHVLFFSKRRIGAGEELTTDYRYKKGAAPTRCRCGSPRCRGTINIK